MASDTAYCIRSDTNPHGVGYVLVPKARKGSFHMFNKPRTGHHDIPTDESQNRLALYMFMDHVALDNRNLYESSQYKWCSAHMLESETIILKEGICTVPSIEKWLQDPFPGLFITVIEATATGLSQRVQMLRSADIFLMKQLHLNRKFEHKQAGLIVLDEVIDFTEKAWFRFVHSGVYNWVICVHSPHMHSINYMLMEFFAAAGSKDFGMQELKLLAAQFEDEHIECHIHICVCVGPNKFLMGNIDHTFKLDICTAAV